MWFGSYLDHIWIIFGSYLDHIWYPCFDILSYFIIFYPFVHPFVAVFEAAALRLARGRVGLGEPAAAHRVLRVGGSGGRVDGKSPWWLCLGRLGKGSWLSWPFLLLLKQVFLDIFGYFWDIGDEGYYTVLHWNGCTNSMQINTTTVTSWGNHGKCWGEQVWMWYVWCHYKVGKKSEMNEISSNIIKQSWIERFHSGNNEMASWWLDIVRWPQFLPGCISTEVQQVSSMADAYYRQVRQVRQEGQLGAWLVTPPCYRCQMLSGKIPALGLQRRGSTEPICTNSAPSPRTRAEGLLRMRARRINAESWASKMADIATDMLKTCKCQ